MVNNYTLSAALIDQISITSFCRKPLRHQRKFHSLLHPNSVVIFRLCLFYTIYQTGLCGTQWINFFFNMIFIYFIRIPIFPIYIILYYHYYIIRIVFAFICTNEQKILLREKTSAAQVRIRDSKTKRWRYRWPITQEEHALMRSNGRSYNFSNETVHQQ